MLFAISPAYSRVSGPAAPDPLAPSSEISRQFLQLPEVTTTFSAATVLCDVAAWRMDSRKALLDTRPAPYMTPSPHCLATASIPIGRLDRYVRSASPLGVIAWLR